MPENASRRRRVYLEYSADTFDDSLFISSMIDDAVRSVKWKGKQFVFVFEIAHYLHDHVNGIFRQIDFVQLVYFSFDEVNVGFLQAEFLQVIVKMLPCEIQLEGR